MCLVNNLSLSEEASYLWYSQEELDHIEGRFSRRAREVRSQLQQYSDLIDEGEGGVNINAAAILGFEKHLSSELTAEYKKRRDALHKAVLAAHRQQCAMPIPHSAATARLATVSAQHSRWARERARAAAVLLEQDVLEDMKDMNLQVKTQTPRRVSMEAGAAEEGHLHPCQRRWEADASAGRHHFQRRWSSSSWSWG